MTNEAKVDIYSPIYAAVCTFHRFILSEQDFCVKTGETYKYILHLVQIYVKEICIVNLIHKLVFCLNI